MNPRISPVNRPAPAVNGKNGITRALNNGASVIASHLKNGEGSMCKNYDPGHLDIVSRPSSSLYSTSVTSSNVQLNTGGTKSTASSSKCPKPVIAVNSVSCSQVTYDDAEAIRVGSSKGHKIQGDATSGQDVGPLSLQKERGQLQGKAGSLSQLDLHVNDTQREVSPQQGNGYKPVNGTIGSSSYQRNGPSPTVSSGEPKKAQPATRSQSFHAEAIGVHTRNKNVLRSRSLSREAVTPSSPQTNHQSQEVLSIEQIRSRVDKFTLSLTTTSTNCTVDPTEPSSLTSNNSSVPNNVPLLSRPAISSSGTKRDSVQGLSVRFADTLPADYDRTTMRNAVCTTTSHMGLVPSACPVDNIPGVDAAIRLCNNTASKKIYIDTVKKPASGRQSVPSPKMYHNNQTGYYVPYPKGQMPNSDDLVNGNFIGVDSRFVSTPTGFYKKNSNQTTMGLYGQQDSNTPVSDHYLFRQIDQFLAHDSTEGTDSSSQSTTISPSGSFGSPSPLRALDQLSPKSGRNSSYTVSPLALTNDNAITLNGSQWTLTPSSSLSSTSSLSKEAAAAATPVSSASPASSLVSLQPPRRTRLPTGSCSEEPPFSLMLMSSSSSSSLLLPTSSSPSSSSTSLHPSLQSSHHPTSYPAAAATAVPNLSSTSPGVVQKSPTTPVSTRPSSACLRSDCLLPGEIDLRTISQLDYLLSPPTRHKHPPRSLNTVKPGPNLHTTTTPFSLDLSSPATKPKLLSFNLPSGPNSPSVASPSQNSAAYSNISSSSKPFSPVTSPSSRDPNFFTLRKNLHTNSSSSDMGSSISSSATSLSSAKHLHHLHHHHMSLQQTLLFPFPPGVSPSSSPSLPSKTPTDSRGSLASLIKKESIAASYQLEYCWFCGRPMPPFGSSLSGGEEHLEKLAELEKLLAQAQSEKVKLVEEQVRIRESEMMALQKNEVLERELQQVKLRERHTQMQARPMTRFLPNTSRDFDLRAHIEGAGHLLDACPHVIITTHSCRGWLHKMGGRIKTWKKRWFVFDRMKRKVFYFTDKSELKLKGSVCFQAIEEVYADHLKTVKSPSPKLTFCMKTFDRTYFLVAPSPETMTIWIDVLFSGAEGYQQFYDS